MGDADPRAELAELAAMTAELLRWEQTIGLDAVADAGRPPQEVTGAATDAVTGTGAAAATDTDVGPGTAEGAGADPAERRRRLELLARDAAACTGCALHRERTQSVFARGSPDAELVFVGEGPGYHEDRQGLPFVGKAGQLLDRMVRAMGYERDDVYICNVVKCRPPDNRTPLPDEAAACEPFLRGQLEAIRPKVIVALGRCASENLGCADPQGGRWRGQWGTYAGIPVMSTYHPAYLLRNPEQKRPVWEDLQQVMARLGRAPPARG